jgi:hypothetical protein
VRRLLIGVLLVGLSVSATAQIAPVGYELVSSVRTGRTSIDYTYRVRVSNSGDRRIGVTGTLVSTTAATTVIDGELALGAIGRDATIVSTDTVTLRQDRTLPFNSAVLQWSFTSTPDVGTPLSVSDLRVLERSGRPLHQSLQVQEDGVSKSADLVAVSARVVGEPASVRLQVFVGNSLAATHLMTRVGTQPEYLVEATLPLVTFELRVIAQNESQEAEARRTITPASVAINFQSPITGVPLADKHVQFSVQNNDAAPKDVVVALSGGVTFVGARQWQVTLAADSETDFDSIIRIPGNAQMFDQVPMTVRVTDRSTHAVLRRRTQLLQITPPTSND